MFASRPKLFKSMATIFILQDKTWIERGSGKVQFEFNLQTYEIHLVIGPETHDQFTYKIGPKIYSKGSRGYVVRAKAENSINKQILAFRFKDHDIAFLFRQYIDENKVLSQSSEVLTSYNKSRVLTNNNINDINDINAINDTIKSHSGSNNK
eukprot:262508_1